MAPPFLRRLLGRVSYYSFGIFNWFLFLGLFMKNGTYFKKDSEKDRLQFAIGPLITPGHTQTLR